jgi:hypothetical protein
MLCMEASRGRFGPFNAPELQLAWRMHFPEGNAPLAIGEYSRALTALNALGVIEHAE